MATPGSQREFDRPTGQTNWLLEIGRMLSSDVEVESLLDTVTQAMVALTNSSAASVLLYDDESHALRFVASSDLSHEIAQNFPVPIEESVAGVAFAEKRIVAIKEAAKFPRHFREIDQETKLVTRSILAVPIIYRGEVLGVLETINKNDGFDYNGEDATVLETLASFLALSFENASLEGIIGRIKEEAARLDKMKTDFIAITSHELRTPLGLIIGHSTFLREIVDKEYHEQMDTIIRNAMRLKEIIENMTSVDNVQAGTAVMRSHDVSIKKIIAEVVEGMQIEAKHKRIVLRTEFDNSDLMLEGDSEKIGMAILNLVRNAVMFTNEGGQIMVKAKESGGHILIFVADNGIGIPAKDLPHIFERFYQVESHLTRKHGGMGLGLSVAKMMIEMHGGSIKAQSIPGKGSNFTITLPVDSSKAEADSKVFIT
ncbi:MAG: GAF domain-containing sensor histidine kinase [Anaerolineales bacterium]|jgi:signal transduction histidine kinase|nr:GAF domain-containing sensor histidine kinase [Anaerolineales bacterium]